MKKLSIEDLRKIQLPVPQPILKKIEQADIYKMDLQKVPETELRNPAADNLTWRDRFIASRAFAGIRRGLNVGVHLAGWTLVNAATLIATGKDVTTSLVSGAALAGGESMLSLAAEKHVKERARGKGKTPMATIEMIVFIITEIFRAWRSRKKKE